MDLSGVCCHLGPLVSSRPGLPQGAVFASMALLWPQSMVKLMAPLPPKAMRIIMNRVSLTLHWLQH